MYSNEKLEKSFDLKIKYNIRSKASNQILKLILEFQFFCSLILKFETVNINLFLINFLSKAFNNKAVLELVEIVAIVDLIDLWL